MSRSLALVEAPSGLGLRAPGVDQLPEAMRRLGLLERLGGVVAEDSVRVPPAEERGSGVLNARAILTFGPGLADDLGAALDGGHFPLVLGGDCSILLGTAVALRRRGRYGLAFIDGHADFYSPDTEPTGEVASMELAIATGREPDELADMEGLRPYFREQDVVVLGVRDTDTALADGSPDIRRTNINLVELGDLRRIGPRETALRSLAIFDASDLDGFWIHLDADVLDDALMPAVDYRLPGGLSADELSELLGTLLASPRAAGLEITIYNPTLDDAELSAGRILVDALAAAFERARAFSAAV